MSQFGSKVALAIGVFLSLQCSAASPDKADSRNANVSDWLIARKNGQWELVAKGPLGHVNKRYPNQEVLRFGANGSYVEVVSMPTLDRDEEVACSQRARQDANNPCASAFLVCRPDAGNGVLSMSLLVFGGAGSAADHRNRLACRADIDGILQAASDVGMIQRILPRAEPANKH